MSTGGTTTRVVTDPSTIPGSLYTSQAVFEREIEAIWDSVWVFLGHESEIPQPGDYCRKWLGFNPVIMSRSDDGAINVLLNRCPHRGNIVCNEDQGHGRSFRCIYHGWTFKNTGELVGVPYPAGYEDINDVKANLGLTRVPRVDSYRGFVFASMAPDGITLKEHLGNAAEAIDRLVDLSPEGELELTAGWMKHWTRSNWKMTIESSIDGYHPKFVHESLAKAFGDQGLRQGPSGAVRDLGNGHSELDFRAYYRETGRMFTWFGGGGVSEEKMAAYVQALSEKRGEEQARRQLIDGPPHVTIFPNLFLGEMNILVIQPLTVDEHIQYTTPVLLKGAPDVNRRTLRQCEGAMGPAGFFIAEDVEISERLQRGLAASRPEHVLLTRGLHREDTDEAGRFSPDRTDETVQRAFWRHYLELMGDRLD